MSSTNVQSAVDTMVRSMAAAEQTKQALQTGMLKKALDGQKQEAQELLKMLSGKGQIIDIRA